MPKGVGSIVTGVIAAFGISKTGCGCQDLANELDRIGPDKVEAQLDIYTAKFRDSIAKWRKNNTKLVPQPPDLVLRQFLLYAIAKARAS